MRKRLGVLFLIASAAALAQPKRIYIAPDDHTDYMWTADEESYRASIVRMLDYYLDLADRTSQEPPEFQSRWHADGSYWLWVYEHDKSPRDFARLISRIRDGHISFPLNAVVSTYGGTPTEAVLRGMYYAGTLERRFGLKIPLAMAMEDQTMPYGLGALWAGSGAHYSWKGICGCATKIPMYGKRPHDIYWWKGDDGSRILMKWNALTPGRHLMGNYLEGRDLLKAIEHVETDPKFKAAYPYPVVGIFGRGGDDLETLTDEYVKTAKAKTTPERRVIVSNMVDFFQDFEKSYGKGLPEFSGSFGNEWDLYTASVSELSARLRRSVEKLRAAEALASVVALRRPDFLKGREFLRNQAWMALGLYWEHDWTADGPVSRAARTEWGRRIVAQVESYVDSLHRDAEFALGNMIPSPPGARRFYVLNPLGWTRTSYADVRYAGTEPVHVVDLESGREVPSQIVSLPAGTSNEMQTCLRVLARDLPSVGYKVFEVRSGKGQDFENAATIAEDRTIENNRYKVAVAGNGAIRSLVDKLHGNREFAGRSLNDLGPEAGEVRPENIGPVSVTLRAESPGPLSHVTRVTVYRDSPSIEIRNDITQNFDGTHSWAFSFRLDKPNVWHEESGAIIRAKLQAEGGDYVPEMSRLEWLTLNHFADMHGADGAGVTLSSADLAFMKLGDSTIVDGVSRLDSNTPRISVLAGGQIDGPSLGIHKQGGDAHFLQRFALRTHNGYSAAQAMKFSLEHQNPPVAGWIQGGSTLPEVRFSQLSVNNPDVLLWAFKPADDGIGRGLVARFWNVSRTPQTYTVRLDRGIAEAYRSTHIETDLGPLPVQDGIVQASAAQSQIQTIRMIPRGAKP